MKSRFVNSKPVVLLLATRPKFLVASAAPVLVGSTAACAISGFFQPELFILALIAIMALHSGANMANDYFDHLSKNDWLNQNPTPFSGGSRYIQQGILSPNATLTAALVYLAAGSGIGLIIVLLTRSIFILTIGLIGLLGAFFYTAGPIKLGYRGIGEFVIALLFGLLPVSGSYYLQAQTIHAGILLPATLVAILIFLVILINEFPDAAADAAVNKKTLVVLFGAQTSIWIYRIILVSSYVISLLMMLIYPAMFLPALLYLFTAPIAALAIKSANKKDLETPGRFHANQITVLLHTVGSLALTVGFVILALVNGPA